VYLHTPKNDIAYCTIKLYVICQRLFSVAYVLAVASPYVAQAGLELILLLPQSSECLDYRSVPPHPAVIAYFENFCFSFT
jgi:hypothetical protein